MQSSRPEASCTVLSSIFATSIAIRLPSFTFPEGARVGWAKAHALARRAQRVASPAAFAVDAWARRCIRRRARSEFLGPRLCPTLTRDLGCHSRFLAHARARTLRATSAHNPRRDRSWAKKPYGLAFISGAQPHRSSFLRSCHRHCPRQKPRRTGRAPQRARPCPRRRRAPHGRARARADRPSRHRPVVTTRTTCPLSTDAPSTRPPRSRACAVDVDGHAETARLPCRH